MIHYTVFQTLQVGFAANRLKAFPVARMKMKRILFLFPESVTPLDRPPHLGPSGAIASLMG
ncbi:MAG: hypothetical protein AB7U29_18420 [Desulfobulbus sp.]